MAGFNWQDVLVQERAKDLNVPTIGPGPTREEEAAQRAALEKTRSDLAMSANPFYAAFVPSPDQSLTTTAGMIGGVLPALAPELKPFQMMQRLFSKAPVGGKLAQQVGPSLVTSTGATAVASPLEQLAKGQDPTTPESLSKTGGKVVENAVLDLSGNLAIALGGKVYNVSKDAYKKLTGKSIGFDAADPKNAARVAAQELLAQYGGTMTRGGLTGSEGLQKLEGMLETLPGNSYLVKRAENYENAINKAAMDIKGSLDVSPEFRAIVSKTDEPIPMAIGERFKQVHALAEGEMKASLAPVYDEMRANGQILTVDLTPMKRAAQQELLRIERTKGVGADADKKEVLLQILKQDDYIPFDAAHDLRSAWLASARDLKAADKPATTLEASFNNAAKAVSNMMDRTAIVTFGNVEEKELARKLGFTGGVDQPAGLRSGQYRADNIESLAQMNMGFTPANIGNNETLRKYYNAQKAYKSAMENLYSDSVSAALKAKPSMVGEMLVNMKSPEDFKATVRAVQEMKKYAPEQAEGLTKELQYGFLEEMFKNTKGIQNWAEQMRDPGFSRTFKYLFRDNKTQQQLIRLADAAHYGAPVSSNSVFMKSMAARAGLGAGVGVGGYFLLPDEAKDKLPETLTTAGVLFLTPRVMSKAISDPKVMNALSHLAQAQESSRYGGALTLKALNVLQQSGAIDNSYLDWVNKNIYNKDPAEQKLQGFTGWENVNVVK